MSSCPFVCRDVHSVRLTDTVSGKVDGMIMSLKLTLCPALSLQPTHMQVILHVNRAGHAQPT